MSSAIKAGKKPGKKKPAAPTKKMLAEAGDGPHEHRADAAVRGS